MRSDEPGVGRRWAAPLAIAGLVGALVSVGFAVVRGDAWRLPLVLVAAAAAVVGLWYALVTPRCAQLGGSLVAGRRRRDARAWSSSTADYPGVPFVVAVASILLSPSAARYALGTGLAKSAALPAGGRGAAPPAAHPVLIMNLKSGGGKAEEVPARRRSARQRGIEAVVLRPG